MEIQINWTLFESLFPHRAELFWDIEVRGFADFDQFGARIWLDVVTAVTRIEHPSYHEPWIWCDWRGCWVS
jgi:hypothetical protein